jgi:hypothetical protein
MRILEYEKTFWSRNFRTLLNEPCGPCAMALEYTDSCAGRSNAYTNAAFLLAVLYADADSHSCGDADSSSDHDSDTAAGDTNANSTHVLAVLCTDSDSDGCSSADGDSG